MPLYPCTGCTAQNKPCGKSFSTIPNQQRHCNAHILKYTCSFDGCGKAFNRDDARVYHEDVVHKNIRWECTMCNSTFRAERSLVDHMKTPKHIKTLMQSAGAAAGTRRVGKVKVTADEGAGTAVEAGGAGADAAAGGAGAAVAAVAAGGAGAAVAAGSAGTTVESAIANAEAISMKNTEAEWKLINEALAARDDARAQAALARIDAELRARRAAWDTVDAALAERDIRQEKELSMAASAIYAMQWGTWSGDSQRGSKRGSKRGRSSGTGLYLSRLKL